MDRKRGAMDVLLVGRGKVTLRQTDHMATGGEGSLYRANNTVVKIFTDRNKMLHGRMDKKLELLSQFTHPYMVAPLGLVSDTHKSLLGYYMNFVDGEPLSRVFTNSFWKRENFSTKNASELVKGMRDVVEYAHARKALLVDANELNWLAVKDKKVYEPRIIDVDSWGIGTWPASVIMPSIQDPHTKGFNEGSDWFAWGIVTFQIYTGIHPYKGTLSGYAQHDLKERMKARASVFRADIQLNKAVRDFSKIPNMLVDWYEAVFEKGERGVPPLIFETVPGKIRPTQKLRIVTTATGSLVFTKLFSMTNDPAIEVYPSGVVRLLSGALVELQTKKEILSFAEKGSVVKAIDHGFVVAKVQEQKLDLTCSNGAESSGTCPLPITASSVVIGNNRLFACTESGLQEVSVRRVGNKPIASIGNTWSVLGNSLEWFTEFGVMDALGAKHLVLPYNSKGLVTVRTRELDGLRTVTGVSYGRIVVLIAISKSGEYRRLDFYFDHDMRTYQVTKKTVDTPELNAVVLPKGVVASIEEDGELVITVPSTQVVNKVKDQNITTDVALFRWEDTVLCIKDGAVWSLRMR